jgi:hypothetical protein
MLFKVLPQDRGDRGADDPRTPHPLGARRVPRYPAPPRQPHPNPGTSPASEETWTRGRGPWTWEPARGLSKAGAASASHTARAQNLGDERGPLLES